MAEEREWHETSDALARRLRDGDLKGAWRVAREALLGRPEGRRPTAGSCADPARARAPDLETVARLCVLAAQYGAEDLARSWLDELERRHAAGRSPGAAGGHGVHRPAGRRERRPEPAGPSAFRAGLDAVRLAVDLASKEYAGADKHLRTLDWAEVPAAGWTRNLRLLVAVRARDPAQVLDVLRGRPAGAGGAPSLRPHDRGNLLRILAIHWLDQGRWERADAVLRAALRELGRDRSVDSLLREIDVRGHLALTAWYGGRIDDAEHALEVAIQSAEELHHDFHRDKLRHQLALVWVERDLHEAAERLLLEVAAAARARKKGRGADHFLETSALLDAAAVAIDLGRPERAEAHARNARRLLEARDHRRYRGHLHIQLGRLVAMDGSRESAAKALEHFDLAEEYFQMVGGGDTVGMAIARLHRSRLFLTMRDVRAAVAEAGRSAAAARQSRCPPVEAQCLLFKSQLLFEQESTRSQTVYEELLGNLAAVRTPATLFKIVANLYLFSWEFGTDLELTVHHLQQINKLQEILDRETWGRLYGDFYRRVMLRAMEGGSRGGSIGGLPERRPPV